MATLTGTAPLPITHFLRTAEEKTLLRFTTAGSVDDGKSTLIGRLLHDTHGAYEDQIEAVKKSKINRSTGAVDFSLLTDGLKAEREQGITIDVAYRYFETARRKFIIADTPGHVQYTRNMATGASTAEVAVILVDARKGVLEQSRRHAYISTLLGIRHLAVAVNKMDLAGYARDVFEVIRAEFTALAPKLGNPALHFIPVSALEGDNVVARSARMPWYAGPSLLEFLETVEPGRARREEPFRFPVQLVIRPDQDFRGFAGQIASGRVEAGQEVLVLPSARRTRVARIVTLDGDLAEAHAPMSVTLCLEDEIDLSRGGLIAEAERPPRAARRLEATLVWMGTPALETGKAYLLRHGPHMVQARVVEVKHRVDVGSLNREPAVALELNEIGTVVIEAAEPLAYDRYTENRQTGGFILIDALTNLTLAAGMIERGAGEEGRRERENRSGVFRAARVTAAERRERSGHGPAVVVMEAGSEAAEGLERRLFEHGADVVWIERPGAALETLLAAGFLVIAPEAGEVEPRIDAAGLNLPSDPEAAVEALVAELVRRGVLDDRESVSAGEGI
jgi:sulfate adenylyltransferase large subunit